MNVWYELGSLVPSICVGLLFWFVMRAILHADRREREAERAVEKEEARAARAAMPGPAAGREADDAGGAAAECGQRPESRDRSE